MTNYVVDTATFVRYLEDRLPARLNRIFEAAERGRAHLFLPQIALAEFCYLALKGRLTAPRRDLRLKEVLHQLSASGAFTVTSMPPEAWEVFLDLKIPEMHDRLIASEAVARKLTLLSNDPVFGQVENLTTIWN